MLIRKKDLYMYLYYNIDNIMKIDNLNKRCLQIKNQKS